MIARRLTSIDALRGVAAIVVVLAHTVENASFVGMASMPSGIGIVLDRLFSFGRVGVTLFFVISGFCIHLQWARARAEGKALQIHFFSFWKRRFTRLYPPFLVALGIYLAAQTWNGTIAWDAFDVYNLVSHLLMLHNFDVRTIFSIEAVFWTLAIEEQLYLAYFLLLYLRNRWSWGPILLICLGCRAAWFALAFFVNRLGNEYRLPHEGGCLANWFIWALGAVSVEATLGLIKLPDWTVKMRYAVACFTIAIACDLVSEHHLLGGLGWRLTWLAAAPIWGAGLFVVVNRLVAAEVRWHASQSIPRLVTIFASLGLFSYSIYLMHHFIFLYLAPALFSGFSVTDSFARKFLSLPLCLALCWVFFLIVERPFISRAAHRKAAPQIELMPIHKFAHN